MGIINDRRELKRLVESYGKEDVLKYVRHLNESYETDIANYISNTLDYFVVYNSGDSGADDNVFKRYPKVSLSPNNDLRIQLEYNDESYMEEFEPGTFHVIFRCRKNEYSTKALDQEIYDLFTTKNVRVDIITLDGIVHDVDFVFPEYEKEWFSGENMIHDYFDNDKPIFVNFDLQNKLAATLNN